MTFERFSSCGRVEEGEWLHLGDEGGHIERQGEFGIVYVGIKRNKLGKNLKKILCNREMEGNRRGNCLDIRSDVVHNFDCSRTHYIEIYSHTNLERIH